MKKIYQTLVCCCLVNVGYGQTTNTLSGGLNQNEVNVVRDGDYPDENSGVIQMVPNGKKAKVMTLVPDSVDGKPLNSSTATLAPHDKNASRSADSTIYIKGSKKNKTKPSPKKTAKQSGPTHTKTQPK